MLVDLIPARCQQQIPVGAHSPFAILTRALRRRLRPRTRLRALFAKPDPDSRRIGKASCYAPGDWVRVLDAERIRSTLDAEDRLRGLWFARQQWPYCGTVHRVSQAVQRLQDDSGRMRAVSRTVLIDEALCGGVTGDAGCGRDCPLMFRDEWLEPAAAPAADMEVLPVGPVVRVHSMAQIRATLNGRDRHQGLLFMPEMAVYAGQTMRVRRRIETVCELGRTQPVTRPIYLLEGLFCSGAILGVDGPCHRSCRLLWHADWLEFS